MPYVAYAYESLWVILEIWVLDETIITCPVVLMKEDLGTWQKEVRAVVQDHTPCSHCFQDARYLLCLDTWKKDV